MLAIFHAVCAWWGLACFFVGIAQSEETAIIAWKFSISAGMIIAVTFYHMVIIFCNIHRSNLLRIFYAVALLYVFFYLTTDVFVNKLRIFYGVYYSQSNLMFSISFIFWSVVVIASFFELIMDYTRNNDNKRLHRKYMFFGYLIGFVGGTSVNLPIFGIDIMPYGNILIPLYCVIITYAVFKHKLMDINIVIQKGLVYSALVTTVTGLYLIFVIFIGRIFQNIVGYQSFFINLTAVFLIAIAFNPLRNFIQQFLDKRFFHGTLESLELETQKLKQELYQKEKLAYVGQLASSVAHEIRNPLTSIKTFLHYLPQKRQDNEFYQEFEKIIPSELERIEKVVNNLLDLAKPKALRLEDADICALIIETLELLDEHFKLKKINVIKSFAQNEMTAKIDKEQMKQVFLNLFLNALQAVGEEGEIKVEIKSGQSSVFSDQKKFADHSRLPARQGPLTTDHFLVIISDNGTGMSKETLSKLFTPFMTTKKEGIGLGMVITQEIINLHGGTIDATSELDKGTTFQITLPRVRL